MGWEALEQWGDDAVRIEPLVGGVANDVWSVGVYGTHAVGRLGVRGDADLDDGEYDIAQQASAAWGAAVCWDDDYAVKRLAEVRPV